MDLICFDLDNTLLDSERAHVSAYNSALKKNGFSPWKFKDIVMLFGRSHEELVSILIESKDKKTIRKIQRYHDRILVNKFCKYARVKRGVKTTLDVLRKRYLLAVVSNASHKSVVSLLDGAGLNKKCFSVIIGNNDVKHSKPSPDEIFKAEKLLHHKARYMVGDSTYDVLAGKRAKVKTIAVLSGRYTQRRLKAVKPDYLIRDFKGLLRIL
ncbi:MAG: HAD-IA family hydrolase [Candidatus Woesearchaeota archaeon]